MQESWDEIVRSAMVVRGLQAATADVVPPEKMPPFFIPPENMSREEVLLLLTRIAERLSWATTEFKSAPDCKLEKHYQDPALLDRAWATPSASGYARLGAVMFQPREGFCGISTFNSALRSIAGAKRETQISGAETGCFVKAHPLPRYVTLPQAKDFFEKVICSSEKAGSSWEAAGGGRVQSVEAVPGGSYEDFMRAVRMLNDPSQRVRICMMYARSPLFFCHGPKQFDQLKFEKFMAAHWSPICAYLEDVDLVHVMDVNHTYGLRGYLIPSRRLFDAVSTRCVMTGEPRGLLLLHLGEGQHAVPPLPKQYIPAEIHLSFGLNKEAYYRHLAWHSPPDGIRLLPDSKGVSAVCSGHPMTFTNSLMVTDEKACDVASVKSLQKEFTKSEVPMTAAIRCATKASYDRVKSVMREAGVEETMPGLGVMILPIQPDQMPAPTGQHFRLAAPPGYRLVEIQTGDTNLIQQWGQVVAFSYGFPAEVLHNGKTPGDFLGAAYSTVQHGGQLRQFACIHEKSGSMIGTSTLVVPSSDVESSLPVVHRSQGLPPYLAFTKAAGMYNICCLKEHRRAGIGRLMSDLVVDEAKRSGCMCVLLEASPLGKPVYERMGFEMVWETNAGRFGGSVMSPPKAKL